MNAPFPKPEVRNAFMWAEMPAGPQPIPDWCKGAHVEWHEGFGNTPTVVLKTAGDPMRWDDMEWRVEDGVYFAKHDDGRLCQHHAKPDLEWSDDEGAWLSPQDRGYGGTWFHIFMAEDGDRFTGDRRRVILRGPWDSTSLPGYCQTSFVDPDAKWRLSKVDGTRPWWRHTAIAGLRMHSDVLLRIVARFEPTVRLAIVRRRSWPEEIGAELVRGDWDAPKHMTAADLVDDFERAS